MEVVFKKEIIPSVQQIVDLYENAGLPRQLTMVTELKGCLKIQILSGPLGMGIYWLEWQDQLLIGFGVAIWQIWQLGKSIKRQVSEKSLFDSQKKWSESNLWFCFSQFQLH